MAEKKTEYRKIARYYDIIERLKSLHYPVKLKELHEYIVHDRHHEVHIRTIQRDILDIENKLGIDCNRNENNNTYYVDEIDYEKANTYLRIFENTLLGDVLQKHSTKKSNSKIIFYTNEDYIGIRHMLVIAEAIENNAALNIQYRKFNKDADISAELFEPYLLKEYDKRWYMIGTKYKSGGKTDRKRFIKSYALDRIVEARLSDKRFRITRTDFEELKDAFENTIGVSNDINEKDHMVHEVVLEMDYTQSKYFETSKWHHSQTIEKIEEDLYHVKMRVMKSYELEQKILANCSYMKVLAPKWLKDVVLLRMRMFKDRYEE
jgi:predicted DNA-binding transcriptional regulator YafY